MERRRDTGTMLDEAIHRFRTDGVLYRSDVLLIQVYLRHWIDAPALDETMEDRPALDELRQDVRDIQDQAGIATWLSRAEDLGLEPL